jgi:uncharacterized protein (TIGR00290 family)
MYLVSWSGGKDSCFACYTAIKRGFKISHLVHFIRENDLHGIRAEIIRLQAELSGISMVQKKVSSNNFESEFKDTIRSMRDIKGMVFGDIYLEEHRSWIERVCRDLNIEALLPLWGMDTESLMNDFINQGFEAIVVSGKKDVMDKKWIGRRVDRHLLEYLRKKPGVDVCGENGEYHTLVIGGPLFKEKINITSSGIIERDNYWFLNVKDFKVSK